MCDTGYGDTRAFEPGAWAPIRRSHVSNRFVSRAVGLYTAAVSRLCRLADASAQ